MLVAANGKHKEEPYQILGEIKQNSYINCNEIEVDDKISGSGEIN